MFGGLDVHKSPTDLQGKYHILKLDFSIDVSSKSNVEIASEEVENNLHNNIHHAIKYMAKKYNLSHDFIDKDPLISLKNLSEEIIIINITLIKI